MKRASRSASPRRRPSSRRRDRKKSDSRSTAAVEEILRIEALEPRILFSGTAAPAEAPAPEAEPDEPVTAQEAEAEPTTSPDATSSPEAGDTQSAAESAPASETDEAVVGEDEAPASSQALGYEASTGESSIPEDQTVVLADSGQSATLNEDTLARLAEAAAERWRSTGLSEEQEEALAGITYGIADLGGATLGVAEGYTILIDDDAAGRGWFADETPLIDEEFSAEPGLHGLEAIEAEAAQSVDLLTLILHEQGHVLGLDDVVTSGNDLMFSQIGEGTRRLPIEDQAEGATAGSLAGQRFLTSMDDNYGLMPGVESFVDAGDGLLANDDVGDPTVAPVVATDNLLANYDASDSASGLAGTWVGTGNSADDFTLPGSGVTLGPATGSVPKITESYAFDGNDGLSNRGVNDLPGDPSDNSATFEFWIKPSVGTDIDRIYETGGSGDGMAVFYEGNGLDGGLTGQIQWTIDDGGQQIQISSAVDAVTTTDFI